MATNVYNLSVGSKRDLPELEAILDKLNNEFENYKYTVYRCATKFVALQKLFFTSNIPYKLVLAVMKRHGISDGDINLMIPPFQLTSLIHDVYFACEKFGHFNEISSYTLKSATAILSNFFWDIYDPHRRHSVSLLEIRITFLLLCKLYESDQLISEIYNLLNHQNTRYVLKLNFEYLVNILAKMFSYIGEGLAYGAQNIQLVVDQCYAKCYNLYGLSEMQFYCLWTTTQTRFLIYANLIALIKRIQDTEKLVHLNVCASCNIDKITGIRFKCQSCKNLSLCLKCFAIGYTTNKHVVGHRMHEVFTEDLPTKKLYHYFSKLCTLFFCSKRIDEGETKGFCNPNETITDGDTEHDTIATSRSLDEPISAKTFGGNTVANSNELSSLNNKMQSLELQNIDSSLACLTTTALNALNVSGKLQTIIDKLIQQNKKLEQQLKCIQTSTKDELTRFLSDHRKFLMNIITEMRNFSQQTSSATATSCPTSSTPNHSNFTQNPMELDNVSVFLFNSNCLVNNTSHIQNILKDNLTHSINGADINRSYLDANKTDYSINDLSFWFNQRRISSVPSSLTSAPQKFGVLTEVQNKQYCQKEIFMLNTKETDMVNFRFLLNKVKEIVEDSYSDNTELSEATQNLENVLDSIIKTEECKISLN